MKHYFVKATGSACYDKTGLTYPEKISLNFAEQLKLIGIKSPSWPHYIGQSNLPCVLSFWATEHRANEFSNYLKKNNLPLILLERNW